ncbi:MAG: hypothetical protein WAM14_11075 [Candidatus Nitrosopolaris sp.]
MGSAFHDLHENLQYKFQMKYVVIAALVYHDLYGHNHGIMVFDCMAIWT